MIVTLDGFAYEVESFRFEGHLLVGVFGYGVWIWWKLVLELMMVVLAEFFVLFVNVGFFVVLDFISEVFDLALEARDLVLHHC